MGALAREDRLPPSVAPVRRKTSARLALLAFAVLAAPSCAPAERAANQLIGRFDAPRGRVIVIVHPGSATVDRLSADLRPVIAAAARDGARILAFALNGGSAAAMTEVGFSEAAGGGDFLPPGKNGDAWREAAEAFAEAAMAEIRPAMVPDEALAATGADLVGAVREGLEKVHGMAGEGELRVVLATGGGVHRTAHLDLVAAGLTPANAPELARQVAQIEPGEAAVEIIGVGRFEGMAVDPQFVEGLKAWWRWVCPRCRFS